ncbi:MNIO family bufferin maturase [Teredinibacter purpureus]|uniref:MNIO family bufferin maturase n=1 Tax=Teredinibacter purpureus TaxID=2731756 RepID=UPI0005F82D59|nr:DUF692 domain-containing protein [Teredinibacter purpureus]
MTEPLPLRCGVGLKAQHYNDIIHEQPNVGWFEIHPENYMGPGGPPHHYLQKIRAQYPLSLHGVGLSLGSSEGVSSEHLHALKRVIDRYQPAQVSEHIAWSHWNSIYLNDLLPLPYTHESLQILCDNIDRTQAFLGRSILIENPSTYIDFSYSDLTESAFINEACQRTGAGLLLDVNNIFVSATNNGFDPYHYIDTINTQYIGEIHLAGHTEKTLPDASIIRIDDHGSAVKNSVWMLFKYLLTKTNKPFPTLIEWDNDIPEWAVLEGEAHKAETLLVRQREGA